MAIVQISKIIHRSGNVESLPQLDGAELGLAADYTSVPGTALNRLFIGPIVPVVSNTSPISNNIEILTQYSIISKISNGNTSVSIPAANGNVVFTVGGNANIMVVTPNSINISRQLISNVAGVRDDSSFSPAVVGSGVAPFIVDSTVTVANLFVDGAERANVHLASADANIYHLTFTSNAVETYAANAGAFTGDKMLYANSGLRYQIGAGNASILTVNGSVVAAANVSVGNNLIGTGSPNNYFLGNWVFPAGPGNSLTAANISAGLNPSNFNGNWVFPPGNSLTVGNLTAGSNPSYLNGNWALAPGATFQATYADLAEYYVADAQYAPGTVLEFGGAHEVTLAEDETARVAGVVSTNPAYGMNANCKGEHVVALALQGRVPCKVRGVIHKGDMLVSGGGGYARPTHSPKLGTIIGKALQDFSGDGVIEVAVGRL